MAPSHAKLSHMHLIPYKLKNDWTWIKQARQGARWEHLAKSAEVLAMLVCFYFFKSLLFLHSFIAWRERLIALS